MTDEPGERPARTDRVFIRDWGDKPRWYCLRIGEMRELEQQCRVGWAEIVMRFMSGAWHIDDAREAIRLGAIGGGALPNEAQMLVERYFDPYPKSMHAPVAQAIVLAAHVGVEAEPVGKAEGASPETDGSSSPPSTDSASPQD